MLSKKGNSIKKIFFRCKSAINIFVELHLGQFIGPPCLFLLGGLSKSDPAVPILLSSGDVLVIGGASRLRFHGVPRVFVEEGSQPIDLFPILAESDGNESGEVGVLSLHEKKKVVQFLQLARININVRQVKPSREANTTG